MKKLSNERLETLNIERHEKGLHNIVSLLETSELEVYKVNVTEALERLNDRLITGKGGLPKESILANIKELTTIYNELEKRIDSENNQFALIDKFIEDVTEQDINFFLSLKEKYSAKELRDMKRAGEINKATYEMTLNPEEHIRSYITKEMQTKKQRLINQIEKKVGKVISLDLRFNNNGSFDGKVIGEEGEANIRTIVAGGYNIQRVHYRTILK